MRTRLSLRARATLFGSLVFAVLLTVGAVLLVSTLESRLTEAPPLPSKKNRKRPPSELMPSPL